MADRFDSTAYKSSSGLDGEASNSSYRFNSGRSDVVPPAEQQSIGGNQSTITTFPEKKIDSQRDSNNIPIKFPEDLADDFYISFNSFKHSVEKPKEARRTFTFEKSIVLPLPTNLTDGTAANYSAEDLYVLGNAAKDLASSALSKSNNSIMGAVSRTFSKKGLNDATNSISKGINKLAADPKKAPEDIALSGGTYLLAGASGPTFAAAKSALQLSANPFPVMIFQGTSFKPAFTFDWVLYPESRSEANIIKKIIGYFRKEMLPERIDTNPSVLRTPAIFQIKIVPKGIGRTFKRCVLTNMAVNYAPNGPSFITDVTGNQDKFNTAVAISLTFQEIEVWLANDYSDSEDNYFDPNPEFQ